MHIIFHPQRRDDTLEISRVGEAITVNGTLFDFSSLPDGALLPAAAIDSELFCQAVERVSGQLVIHLVLPLGPNPAAAEAFPESLQLEDGQTLVLGDQETIREVEQ